MFIVEFVDGKYLITNRETNEQIVLDCSDK